MHLTGVTGKRALQKIYIFSDIVTCITNTKFLYLVHKHTHQFRCIQEYLFRCLLRNTPNNLTGDKQQYCGAFSVSQRNHFATELTVSMTVLNGHILHIEVLQFNFQISRYIRCADHGIIFVYKLHRSGYYCGRRVPWMMMIPTEEAYLHMIRVSNVKCQLNIFYSSFQNNWIKQLIRVKQIRLQNHRIISSGVENNINYIQYYILTNYINRIKLDVTSSGLKSCYLSLHDGPGALSRIIFQLNSTDTSGVSMVSTSAYWAFFNIFIPDSYVTDMKILITVYIKLANNLKTSPKIIFPSLYSHKSDNMENTGNSDFFEIPAPNEIIFLHVNIFIFSGPNTLSDSSSQRCQYGGLAIRFDSTENWFEFCEDISNLSIHSSHGGIYVSLFWFAGYSIGSILATLQKTRCGTLYLEHNPALLIQKENIISKVNESLGCHYIVCPPLHTDIQRLCTLQLGPPSVGSTEIVVIVYPTLNKCDQRFVNIPSEQKITYHLRVTYSTDWPFDIHNSTTRETLYKLPSGLIHKYQYLESGNISATLICTNKFPRGQVAFFVQISNCAVKRHAVQKTIAMDILAFSDGCLMVKYRFMSLNKRFFVNNLHFTNHFIYKDTGHINTGHFVSVHYDDCPVECQDYQYTVFVRHPDERTIIAHTAHVGHVIFTGYYHKGFRVSISLPEEVCWRQLKCILTVHIFKITVPIGLYNNYNDIARTVRKLKNFIFYNKR